MKDWLDSVSKMAFLNGVVDFHFSEDVIEALAYAYHVKFTPIEAAAFCRLVSNRMGDNDPDKVREIEARAQKLVLVTNPPTRATTPTWCGSTCRVSSTSRRRLSVSLSPASRPGPRQG